MVIAIFVIQNMVAAKGKIKSEFAHYRTT
jgi:hypothetical protein